MPVSLSEAMIGKDFNLAVMLSVSTAIAAFR